MLQCIMRVTIANPVSEWLFIKFIYSSFHFYLICVIEWWRTDTSPQQLITSNFPRNCPCHPLLQAFTITFVFALEPQEKKCSRKKQVLKNINSTTGQQRCHAGPRTEIKHLVITTKYTTVLGHTAGIEQSSWSRLNKYSWLLTIVIDMN